MKAILLAAGYATRLRPLTDRVAKPLLPVGGRPIADRICDILANTGAVDAVHAVTNSRYAADFEAWAKGTRCQVPVIVHDDGTTTNENRRGAIGDVKFVVDKEKWADEDVLVVAGDNLIGDWFGGFVEFWRQKASREPASATALFRCPDRELVKEYSAVETDERGRVVSFVEKPKDPRTDRVGIATYIYHREHIKLVDRYLNEGNSSDQPGNLIAWLHRIAPVYGFPFEGEWLDIGNLDQLTQADNLMREREGLPRRDHYDLS